MKMGTRLGPAALDEPMHVESRTPFRRDARDAQRRLASAHDAYVSRFHRLTPREVRVLTFVLLEEMSHSEVGDALGVSRATVANIVQRIRRKLAVPVNMKLATFILGTPSLAPLLGSLTPALSPSAPCTDERAHGPLRGSGLAGAGGPPSPESP